MLEFIQRMFVSKGFTKPKTEDDKLLRLRNAKISFYVPPMMTERCICLQPNILVAIERYTDILKFDIEKEHIIIPPVTRANYINISIGEWCVIDGKCISNLDEVFKEWLELASRLVAHYTKGSKDYYNPIYSGNSVVLRPYVNDINTIIDHMLKLL